MGEVLGRVEIGGGGRMMMSRMEVGGARRGIGTSGDVRVRPHVLLAMCGRGVARRVEAKNRRTVCNPDFCCSGAHIFAETVGRTFAPWRCARTQ